MILDAASSCIWAPPVPLPFRVLGLDGSHTGHRGVSMWNPPEGPVETITLLHGGSGGGRPGVRAICRSARHPANGWSATRDAIAEALLILPPPLEVEDRAELTTRWGTPPRWQPVDVTVDDRVVRAQRHRHHDGRWWVVGVDLGDVGLCLIGHGRQVEDHGVVTLDPDLPGYTARPPRTPPPRT